MPTRSPGRTSKEIPLSTQFGVELSATEDAEDAEDKSGLALLSSVSSVVESSSLYANQTSSKTMCPGAGDGRGVGRAGDSIATGSSSSLKIRSEEAIADCRTLNFSDMSLMGRKNRCEYWMKATSAPSVSVPRTTP